MSRVVIIGIDGFDPFLLYRWKNDLPNTGKFFNEVSEISMDSTFPPDSICAWASIYTGENPAKHGLLESINYLSNRKLSSDQDRSAHFRGNTFWDRAGRSGKTVCVINPFIAYPAWKVNGIMVSGPVFEGGDISAYPESILRKYQFPALGGIVDFPDEKDLGGFIDHTKKITEQLSDVSLRLYIDRHPDLFFLSFLTLDRIKHFLWRFTDIDDIYYPGENSYKNVIRDFYVLFDRIIGNFVTSLGNDTSLVVISDHGHRRRCSQCLNLNEILRQKGYLATSGNGASGELKKLIEKAKVFTVESLAKLGLQDWIYKIAKFVPHRKALKKSTYLIDNEASSVTLSNLCGTNPYGGLDIKPAAKNEYESLRDEVIRELLDINNTFGRDIVKWVKKREDVYQGEYEKRLPDIFFELYGEYGVGMDLYAPPLTENYSHKKISGGHKREAVLLTNGINDNIKRPDSVMELNNFILQIMES